jgi:hypothetical protein
MSFSITHVSGAMEQDPPQSAIAALVEELASADAEHPDVALADESGWSLSAFRSGRVVWENVEDDDVEPRHLTGVRPEQVVVLFETLAAGDVGAIEQEPWMAGY